MTLREAAQQALEALEKVTKHFTRTPSTLMDSEARVEAHKAITALRERLAQPEQEPVCWTVADGWVYPDDTERVDEIVKAEQGIRKPWETLLMMTKTAYGIYAFTHKDLERFAALVAAEKEKQIIDILRRLQERNDSHNYYAYSINVIKGELMREGGKK